MPLRAERVRFCSSYLLREYPQLGLDGPRTCRRWMTAAVSSVTEGFCRGRVVMIPTIAVAVMLCTVAGCCIYISYRIGQSISPASRVIQRRLSRVEAGVARSEATVERALDHHRHASSEQIARVLHESTERLTQLVELLRRPIDELHDRLNGVRLDLAREQRLARGCRARA